MPFDVQDRVVAAQTAHQAPHALHCLDHGTTSFAITHRKRGASAVPVENVGEPSEIRQRRQAAAMRHVMVNSCLLNGISDLVRNVRSVLTSELKKAGFPDGRYNRAYRHVSYLPVER